jgi:hypothetical protein
MALLTSIGCREAKPDRLDTIIELDCGPLRIRFQEQVKEVNSLAGVRSYTELLHINRGEGWQLADSAGATGSSGHRGGPEGYSGLLPADLSYRALPFDDETRPDTPSRSRWGVFLDPKVVSREDYEVVSQCVAKNLKEIDAAFDAPRKGEAPRDPDQRRRLSSLVHAAFDDEMNMCGEKTIGRRWECPGGGYVKTRLTSPHLILCANEQPESTFMVTRFPVGMIVGAISPDQKQVELWKADPSSHDYRLLLAGKDPGAYYASCRDRGGRGLLETFAATGAP